MDMFYREMKSDQEVLPHESDGIAGMRGIAGMAGIGGIFGMGGIGGIFVIGKMGPLVAP